MGFCCVLLLPLPKFQAYETALVDVFVKVTTAPLFVWEKPVLGVPPTVTRLVWVAVLLPAALPTVSVAEYVPGVA